MRYIPWEPDRVNPKVTRAGRRWIATHDCGWSYTNPDPDRVHDEARHHTHRPYLGPRPLPPGTSIRADYSGYVIHADWEYGW